MMLLAVVCVSLLAALLMVEATGGGGGTFIAFGPQSFIRAPGKPITVTKTFALPNPATSYTLRLTNGGLQGEFARVSSAVVTLNGAQVVRPNDLKQTVAVLNIPVTLSSTNTLTVELRSQPGSGLGLQILGVDTDLPRVAITAPPPGSRLTNSAVHVTGTVSDLTSGIAGVTCNGVTASVAGSTFQCDVTLSEGPQTITVQATDLAGNWGSARVDVNVATNQVPIARAGAGQTVGLGQTVTLDGSKSTDADGDPLSYVWSFVTRPAGSQVVLNDPTLVRPTFVVDRAGNYVVQLVVNDGQQHSTPDTVIITTQNSPPVAQAGPDQTVAIGTTVQLDGSPSSDVDGDALTFRWAFMTHLPASNAVLSTPYDVRSTFTLDQPGTYVLQLTVHDGLLPGTPDTVSITTQNSPPVAHAGSDQAVVVGDTVQLTGRLSRDVDGDTLTFRWAFLARPPGSSATLSDPTGVTPTFVVDQPGLYVVQLLVNDSQVDSVPDTVSITTQNTRPVAHAGPDQAIFVGDTVQLDGRLSSDADRDPLQYYWSLSTTPPGSLAALSDVSAATPSFLVDFPGTYVAQLVVSDGHLDSTPDTVTLSTQNSQPVAHAGPDQTVALGETVRLDGSASRDADGDPLTYRWALIALPAGSTASLFYGPVDPPGSEGESPAWPEESPPGSEGSEESPPDMETPAVPPTFVADRLGTYVAQLIVHDGTVESTPDTVVVTAVNRVPVAQAGLDQTVVVGTTVQLDGRASRDADGNPLTYAWTLLVRPAGSAAALAGATTSTPTFVADQSGTYQAQLIVHDGMVDSAPHSVTITAQPAPLDPRQITVQDSTGGQVTITGQTPTGTPGTRVTATNGRTGQTVTVAVPLDGRFTLAIAAQADDTLALAFTDATGVRSAIINVPVGGALPPDPSLMAPPLDPTVATTLTSATAFLYTGPTPLQRGVAAGTIVPQRVAVVRGKVLGRTGNPMPGVTITIKDHPELGLTTSRADGMFDLAVNGGGLLTVQYAKPGHLPVQRQVQTPWQDYVFAEDVVLMTLDPQVARITLNGASGMQVAQGSRSTDADGTRQATLLFPANTTARMRLADGTTQPLSTLHVRATEYTVGPTGPKAMPGPLPLNSGYTYAVELSVDEALAAGATRVDFSQPVPLYVDNFLRFPVGGIVPVGWYDRERATWMPADNGTIIRLLGVDNVGLAMLDVDGSGQAADVWTLLSLGISEAEQTRLATLYPVGKSLWRVPIAHFTPWDSNWPYGPPEDAVPPPLSQPGSDDEGQPDPDDSTQCSGCSIEAQSQTLGEEIPLTGTPLRLHYRSDRAPGRHTARIARIPVSDESVPPSLLRIALEIEIAGRQFSIFLPPLPRQTYTFVWDGLDAYGRAVVGDQRATVKVGYAYTTIYLAPAAFSASFRAFMQASASGATLSRRGGQESRYWRTWQVTLRALTPDAALLGGWSLDVQHAYDATHGVYYAGDGAKRHDLSILGRLESAAIFQPFWWRGDGGLATQARLNAPWGVAVAPDGSVYAADRNLHRVLRVAPDGVVTTVAGTGEFGFSGDGGPATQARLNNPRGVAVAPDGSVYIADFWNHRIRRVSPGGLITTVAGNGNDWPGSEGVLATQTGLYWPEAVALGRDGSLYIAASGERRIRRVSPEGLTTTVAGSGQFGSLGDGDLATQATLLYPVGVAVAPDGSVYIADPWGGSRIRRVGLDGIITTVAGGALTGRGGDGSLATQVDLSWPESVAVGADGSVYIGETGRLLRLGPDGRLTTVAGTGEHGFGGDGGPATQAQFHAPTGITPAADGSVYIADPRNHRIRRVSPNGVITTMAGSGVAGSPEDAHPAGAASSVVPGFAVRDAAIASPDGALVHHFDASGRHLRTIDTIAGRDAYVFGYDPAGRLITVTDLDGDITRIERDAAGRPLAIVAPDGQRTVLHVHPSGYLAAVTNPAGEASQMAYTADGLMTAFTTPRGHANRFVYDTLGRLLQDTNAGGGGWALTHTPHAQGYTNRLTSAEGRTSTFAVVPLPTGERRQINTAPDGTVQETRFTPSGEEISTAPDGTVITRRRGPDPRFGMQADVSEAVTLATPAGLTAITTTGRTATLADPDNPLRTSLIETVTVNGRATTRHFDGATSTWTVTSPMGRTSTVQLNSTGRPVTSQVAGLEAVHAIYDLRGRLTATTVGQGAEARTTTISYYASGPSQGYVESLTDALGRSVHFAYDLAGRVTTQTLPDGRAVHYAYDANGNLTALTPPGQPVHRLDYTPLDQEEAYTPPDVGAGDPATRYTYNRDRQLTHITRPDGQTVALTYTPGGALESLRLPHGDLLYAYAPALLR